MVVHRISSVLMLSFLLSCSVYTDGQRGRQTQQPSDIRITITYEDERFVPAQVKIELLNGVGNLVAQKISDRSGQVTFTDIFPGTYQLRVISTETEDFVSEMFTMFDSGGTHFEPVRLRPKVDAKQQSTGGITVSELNIPEKARSEYNKGMAALQRNENAEARARFEKAIRNYPNYGAAYNNLGVMAMNAGDPSGGEANFKQAITVDPKYAPAYVNLARIMFQRQNFSAARDLLETASKLDDKNPEAFTLLANACLSTKDYDLAIASAEKVHSLPQHERFGVVHFLAAEALERKGESAQALAQYQLFLQEAPQSPMATNARDSIAMLQKTVKP